MNEYLYITSVTRPQTAHAGTVVSVSFVVTSKASGPLVIWAGANDINGQPVVFSPDQVIIDQGASITFSTSFVMPATNTQLAYGVWYHDGTEWILDIHGTFGFTVVNGNGEEPPDDEELPDGDESWLEGNTLLIVGGVALATVLGIVLVRK
ncbi:MAG TPA: hypothetical protein VMV84_01215 [Dehalococcoidales bacterium]|nr:hypothetical protein [Dehalococcoidales bacterium]